MTNESSKKENKKMSKVFQEAASFFQEEMNKPHSLVVDYSDGLHDGFLGGAVWGYCLAIGRLRSEDAKFEVNAEDWELVPSDCANWLEEELEKENE